MEVSEQDVLNRMYDVYFRLNLSIGMEKTAEILIESLYNLEMYVCAWNPLEHIPVPCKLLNVI
jgi:hypothetical protein